MTSLLQGTPPEKKKSPWQKYCLTQYYCPAKTPFSCILISSSELLLMCELQSAFAAHKMCTWKVYKQKACVPCPRFDARCPNTRFVVVTTMAKQSPASASKQARWRVPQNSSNGQHPNVHALGKQPFNSDCGLQWEGELGSHTALVQDDLLVEAHFLFLLLLQLPAGLINPPAFLDHRQTLFRQASLRFLQLLGFFCQGLLKFLEPSSLLLLQKSWESTTVNYSTGFK